MNHPAQRLWLLERDAFTFTTLDDAIAWTDVMKRTWLCRGWTEVSVESDDGRRCDPVLGQTHNITPKS